MSLADNKLFIRRYFDTFNQGGGKAVSHLVADHHLKEHIALFESAFPGYQLSAKSMIAEGDKVVVDATLQGTHKGVLMGIPPTNKQVDVSIIIIYRVANGQIVEHTMVADQMSLMQQLGVVPA
jgi:predicted ester cyclase